MSQNDDTISRQAAIDADGLDEEIRCEMCKNPMHTDRGCDGNCKYDEILYEKIIQILNKRITPLPSAQHTQCNSSNVLRHPQCANRTKLGNCDPVGGFCTSVPKEICDAQEHNTLNGSDLISRQKAIDAAHKNYDTILDFKSDGRTVAYSFEDIINALSSEQPEKETAKRVLWTGWKGTRDTRYKCPNCKKPVKNDDVYCHRCGQKLMFPHISFTDYIPGERQELIVRWDDE